MADGRGLAAVCDDGGRVLQLVRQTLDLEIVPNCDLASIVDAADRPKYQRFLATALSRQAAFDWSINVMLDRGVATLHFGAAYMDGKLVVIAAETRTDLARLSQELAADTGASTARLREVLRESARQLEMTADSDAHLYDELTRLTNELTATQRRLIKTNIELTRANEQLRAFYETLPMGVFRVDRRGVVERANRRFQAVTGSAPGATWLEHVHSSDRPRVERQWEDARDADSELASLHRRRDDPDERDDPGEPAYLQCRLVPLRDDQRAVAGFVGIVEDVTARLAAERQARDLERHRAIHDVTAGVAHNLNNMMAVILGSAEMLEEELPGGHPLHGTVRMNIEATQRSAALVRHLMMYSGLAIASDEWIDLHAEVSQAAERARHAAGRGERIAVGSGDENLGIKADRGLLAEAIEQLVLNALQATAAGGRIEISVTAERSAADKGRSVVIAVMDDGSGMDTETAARATEPFFTTHEVGQGIGLGLSFVDGFARRYDGALEIESQPEKGTAVRLRLPLADA